MAWLKNHACMFSNDMLGTLQHRRIYQLISEFLNVPLKSPEKTVVSRGSENDILSICVLWETVKLRYFIFELMKKQLFGMLLYLKFDDFFITHVIPSCNLMWLSLTCTELWNLLSHCVQWNGLTPHAKSFLYFCNN